MKMTKRTWIILAVLFLAIALAAVVYVLRYDPFFRRVSDSKPTGIFTLDGAKQNYFSMSGDQLLIVNNDGVTAINRDGSIRYAVDIATGDTFFRVSSRYILIADRRGKEARLISDGSVQAKIHTDTEIVAGSVCDSGKFVLVTTEEGYRSKVSLYNSQGEEEYVWKIASNYVVDACVSNDGKKLVAAVMSVSENELMGGVAFVDVDSQKIMDTKLAKDNTVVRVGFTNDDTLVAIGESHSEGYNKNGEIKWTLDYGGRQLQTFDFEPDNALALAFENSSNNSRLEIYGTSDGKTKGGSDLDFEITSIDMVSDTVLATGARNMGIFSHSGAERVRYNSERELRYGGLLGNRNEAYIIGGTTVEIVKP